MSLVTSREYKLLLQPQLFLNRVQSQKEFWLMVQGITNEQEIKIKGWMNEEVQRQVRFIDTPNQDLLAHGYVLRQRIALKNGQPDKTKAMLKFRSPDRYIAAGVDVTSPLKGSETKFEEDILPPFKSQYSHSTSAEISNGNWTCVKDVTNIFPGLTHLNLDGSMALQTVQGFVAHEVVVRGVILDFGKNEATTALTFWYTSAAETADPILAEFSFCYGNETGEFSAKSAKRAKEFFEAMQALEKWYQPDAITKTASVYSYSQPVPTRAAVG